MRRCWLGGTWLLVWLCGCSDPAPPVPPVPSEPSVIAGVSCDPELEPRVESLEIHAEAPAGVAVLDEVRSMSEGTLAFPFEVALPQQSAQLHGRLTLRALDAAGGVLVERTAETSLAEDGSVVLMRVRLNDECAPDPSEPQVDCGSGRTCVGGVCDLPFVSRSRLEEYRSDWAAPYVDACVGEAIEPAAIELGFGDAPFQNLPPNTTFDPVPGLQGGSHIYIGVRSHGLHADGAVTAMWGTFPQTGDVGSVQKSPATYAAGSDGCEAFAFRYVLPFTGAFNQPMRLGVSVIDATGNAAHTHIDVQIGDEPPPL